MSNLDTLLSWLIPSNSILVRRFLLCSLFWTTSITSNSGFLEKSLGISKASTNSSNGYSWFSYAFKHTSFISFRNSSYLLSSLTSPLIASVFTNIPSMFSVSLWVLALIGLPITISSCLLYLFSNTIAAERNIIYSVVPVFMDKSLIFSLKALPVDICIIFPSKLCSLGLA